MTRNVLLGVCTVFLALVARSSQAAVFFTDQFNYANGDLTVVGGSGNNVSGGLWTPHSGQANAPSISVVNGKAQLLVPGSEDANREIPNALTDFMKAGETWYYGARVTVNDQRASTATALINEYFMHFKDTGTTNFRSRLYVADPSTGTGGAGFRFAIGASSGVANAVNWGSNLNFGQQYTVIASYNFDTGFAKLWVNPVNQASTSIEATAAPNPGTFVTSLAIRQAFLTGATANEQILVDAVSMANNFGDVLAAMVPEPTSISLAVASLLALGAARRRRGN